MGLSFIGRRWGRVGANHRRETSTVSCHLTSYASRGTFPDVEPDDFPTTTEIARVTGVSPRIQRHLERLGILEPAIVDTYPKHRGRVGRRPRGDIGRLIALATTRSEMGSWAVAAAELENKRRGVEVQRTTTVAFGSAVRLACLGSMGDIVGTTMFDVAAEFLSRRGVLERAARMWTRGGAADLVLVGKKASLVQRRQVAQRLLSPATKRGVVVLVPVRAVIASVYRTLGWPLPRGFVRGDRRSEKKVRPGTSASRRRVRYRRVVGIRPRYRNHVHG